MSNNTKLKILFIEDLPSDVDLAVLELRSEKLVFDYETVCTREDLIEILARFRPDLIISDYMMPSYDGMRALKDVMDFDMEIPFILYTGSINEETAVRCIKAGAVDYVIKEHMTRLPFAVKEALEQVRIKREKKASDLLLQESEEKIQSIFRAAPVGIGLVVSRVFIEVNDTFCKMTGYSRNELIGNNSEMIYPSREEYELVGTEKYKQISSFGSGSVETRIKRKDGVILNIIMSSTPLDINDLSKGVTFTVLDITDRYKTEESLKLSEEKFRSIAENLSDIIFLTDMKGILTYVSPSVAMLGYSQDEFTGRFFGDFLATGEIEKAMPLFNNALNAINISSTVQLVFKRNDGSTFFAELSGSVFYVENEKQGVLGLLRDVSDKVKRESELRKLSRAVEQNPVSIVITDTNGIIEYVNPKMCDVTGYGRGELIGKNPNVLSSKEKSREEYKILWDTIKNGDDWKGEFRNKKKNGELYWESATISPIKNEKNKITHFLGIKEDITGKKLLEASVIESEQRYRELFMFNPFPTYLFDSDSLDFIEVNEATVLNYGYSREEFSRMSLKDLRIPEDVPALIETVRNLGDKPAHSTNLRHRRKDGTVFPIENTSFLLPVKNGKRIRLSMSLDITGRMEAEKKMKLAQEKAEASDRLKTTFLNNISHEVRTPLNGILGFAEIMSQVDLSESDRIESLIMLEESSDRLLNTITSYMDISLLTSGNLSLNKKDFFPAMVLKGMFELFEKKCSLKNLKLVLEIPEDLNNLIINSDPEVFQKILSHLLNNAIKFTEKGVISYGYLVNNTGVEFYVKDTGIGIGENSINSIFDHFVKEDRGPSRLSEGSGLGLSVAKGMIEFIGGKIRVESEIEIGSSFCFTVPLIDSPKVSLSDNKDNTHFGGTTLMKILVAEDDETNFFYLNALLTRETNAKIIHATNGREAIDLYKANPDIQLILMDIKMPLIDGLEATRQIKAINSDVPVIAITAYAMSGDEDRVISAGCDGYLSKPLSKKSLLDKMAEFISVR